MNKKNTTWITLTGLCVTISLIVGMIGGALTNEYLIGYVFNTFVNEENEENLPIIKKVIEQQTYVEESAITQAVEVVSASTVTLYASSLDLSIALNEENSNKRFQARSSDEFYFGESARFGDSLIDISGGNGFFVTTDGLIATCDSVVKSQQQWNVLDSKGNNYLAEIVYENEKDDLTFLKIRKKDGEEFGQKPVIFAANDLAIGQKVLAVGSSAGSSTYLKSGVVSYVSVKLDELKRKFPYEFSHVDFEVDRELHCSPIVNLKGEVQGIVLDFDLVEQGTSYVIPISVVSQMLSDYSSKLLS